MATINFRITKPRLLADSHHASALTCDDRTTGNYESGRRIAWPTHYANAATCARYRPAAQKAEEAEALEKPCCSLVELGAVDLNAPSVLNAFQTSRHRISAGAGQGILWIAWCCLTG